MLDLRLEIALRQVGLVFRDEHRPLDGQQREGGRELMQHLLEHLAVLLLRVRVRIRVRVRNGVS